MFSFLLEEKYSYVKRSKRDHCGYNHEWQSFDKEFPKEYSVSKSFSNCYCYKTCHRKTLETGKQTIL